MSDAQDLSRLVFGRLTWDAIPLHEPILLATFAGVVLGGLAMLFLSSAKGRSWLLPFFGLSIPAHVPGIPDEVLDPRQAWADKSAYDKMAKDLVGQFEAQHIYCFFPCYYFGFHIFAPSCG